ncbi:MAG: transposase, partial [Candidatus Korobacteraceae bacterium]
LGRYVAGICKAKQIVLVTAGGTTNHVHLLIDLHPSIPLSKAMQEVKGNSSRWLNETQRRFAWQQGYGAFSVSQSQRGAVIRYIDNQEEHHRKRSFEEEFVALLRKCGMSHDPKYVFG